MVINLIKSLYINWSPLFILISRHGVVFYTDDNKAGLHYYRQTPVQRKVYTVSCGFLKHDEKDQISDSGMEAKDAEWKSIAGSALMNVYDPEKQSTKFGDLRLVADTALQCIKCVPNISCSWRSPRETFFTSLILCSIMSKKALISSHSH